MMTPILESRFALLPFFLAYGLALFTVSIAIALQWRRDSSLPLTRALPALAIFAFLHALHAWAEMLVVVRADLLGLGDAGSLNLLSTALDSAAFLFLLWFGVDVVAGSRGRALRWLALLPLLLWGGVMLWVVMAGALSSEDPVDVADNLARYLLGLPGIMLAAWGLFRHRRVFFDLGMPDIASSCTIAAASLLLYGLLNNLIGTRMPFFPANVINFRVFTETVGVSALAPRAVLSLVAAYFLVRILRAYQHEQDLRLRRADEECCRAQQEKMEAQQRDEARLRSWNETLERRVLARTHDLERRRREAEALHEIGTQITSFTDISSILSAVTEHSRILLGADLASVVLMGEDQSDLRVSAISGNRTDALTKLRLEPGRGIIGMAAARGEPVVVSDYLTDAEVVRTSEFDAAVVAEGLRATLAAPMKAGGRVLGVLCVASRGDRCFDSDDLVLLSRLTVVASLGIENSRLYAQAQRAAVLEERNRISREIHDGLAQALAILATMARSTRDRLKNSRDVGTIEKLMAIEETAHEAYSDARRAIQDLRFGGGPGLLTTLEESLRRFGAENGVDTEFVPNGAWPDALPPDTRAQVARVVSEALANVRKHASASRVRLEIGVVGSHGIIAVQDDGLGFDQDKTGGCAGDKGAPSSCLECEGCRFGLRTMRERAESIGGYLRIESILGEGARVVLGVPLQTVPIGSLASTDRSRAIRGGPTSSGARTA